MKRILAFISVLLFSLASQAQGLILVRAVAANTVSNYLAGRYIIDTLEFENLDATNATVKLYDWATAATNIVRAAYTSKTSYATNYSTVYTNSAGIATSTNTFVGTYIANVTTAAATNEQTRLREYIVPASTLSELTEPPQVARGLTLLSTQAGTLRIYYRAAQ